MEQAATVGACTTLFLLRSSAVLEQAQTTVKYSARRLWRMVALAVKLEHVSGAVVEQATVGASTLQVKHDDGKYGIRRTVSSLLVWV